VESCPQRIQLRVVRKAVPNRRRRKLHPGYPEGKINGLLSAANIERLAVHNI